MKVNPSVRLYTLHQKEHIVLNYDVLEFNLEKANRGNPGFTKFFDFKKDFNLKNLSPTEVSRLSQRIASN